MTQFRNTQDIEWKANIGYWTLLAVRTTLLRNTLFQSRYAGRLVSVYSRLSCTVGGCFGFIGQRPPTKGCGFTIVERRSNAASRSRNGFRFVSPRDEGRAERTLIDELLWLVPELWLTIALSALLWFLIRSGAQLWPNGPVLKNG